MNSKTPNDAPSNHEVDLKADNVELDSNDLTMDGLMVAFVHYKRSHGSATEAVEDGIVAQEDWAYYREDEAES